LFAVGRINRLLADVWLDLEGWIGVDGRRFHWAIGKLDRIVDTVRYKSV